MAVERRVAMTRGALAVQTMKRSSSQATSRTQCSLLSGSPGASLRRGPLRTVRATGRRTRLRQPAWAGTHRARRPALLPRHGLIIALRTNGDVRRGLRPLDSATPASGAPCARLDLSCHQLDRNGHHMDRQSLNPSATDQGSITEASRSVATAALLRPCSENFSARWFPIAIRPSSEASRQGPELHLFVGLTGFEPAAP